uniref:PH domain-containing protein n=1 Tax=Vannella robusta TaxID=1487602 RepID=A0A7S4HT60_9EUKA
MHQTGFIDLLSGNKNSIFSTHYFLLRGATLFWFKRRSDPTHCGCVLLRDCKIEQSTITGGFTIISSSGQKIVCKVNNNAVRDQWMKSLASASGTSSERVGNLRTTKRRYRSRSSPGKHSGVYKEQQPQLRHSCKDITFDSIVESQEKPHSLPDIKTAPKQKKSRTKHSSTEAIAPRQLIH